MFGTKKKKKNGTRKVKNINMAFIAELEEKISALYVKAAERNNLNLTNTEVHKLLDVIRDVGGSHYNVARYRDFLRKLETDLGNDEDIQKGINGSKSSPFTDLTITLQDKNKMGHQNLRHA